MTIPPATAGQAADHVNSSNLNADGPVVLDIGADIGALVLYASPDLAGTEIEISPAPGPASRRTHAIVRARRSPGVSTIFAAVYPGLPAGTYTIWRDASTPAGQVQVNGGEVAIWRWDAG